MRLITKPTVSLVAETMTNIHGLAKWLESNRQTWPKIDEIIESDNPFEFLPGGEFVVEAAGRQCYNSFKKGRPTKEWFENVIAEGHYSVLRHTSFTFAVSGVSRSLLQQIARHHHMDPSVLSQRFVDQGDDGVDLGLVVPPAMVPWCDKYREGDEREMWSPEANDFCDWYEHNMLSLRKYARLRDRLVESGLSRKEAGEAARSVLPECMETRFFISANGEGWLHYLRKRLPEGVDAEHRRLATEFARLLKEAAPNIFASIEIGGGR